jgi:Lrp/AsnC family transcriptional regulator, regulator for asnA, asnC and gidA
MEIENEEINSHYNIFTHLDKTDFRIVSLLVLGSDNKKISSTLKIPLSTIQRRTRRILQSGIVHLEYTPNFKLLGLKKGLLHTYLHDGQLRKTGEKISKMDGILSVTIHVGNSDVVSEFVYDNSEELVDIIAAIKQIEGVDRVMWSEEVFKLLTHKENIMKSFQKYWKENTNYNNNNNGIRKNNNNNNNNNNQKNKQY